jgi:hypothetical protein
MHTAFFTSYSMMDSLISLMEVVSATYLPMYPFGQFVFSASHLILPCFYPLRESLMRKCLLAFEGCGVSWAYCSWVATCAYR